MPNLQSNLGLLTTHRHRPLELTIGTILLLSKWRDREKNPTPHLPQNARVSPMAALFFPIHRGARRVHREKKALGCAAGCRSRATSHHSPAVDPRRAPALLVRERRRHLLSRCGRRGTAAPIARSVGEEELFCVRDGTKRPRPTSPLHLLGQAGARECRAIGR